MFNDVDFLGEGRFTKRTARIKEIAGQLENSGIPVWQAASWYVRTGLNYNDSDKSKLFRKRIASEIIESGFKTGCTEIAIVFACLAREMGIPTRYVETFEEQYLNNGRLGDIQGHVFVDMLLDGEWKGYEPKTGNFLLNGYVLNGRRYIEAGKGIDFSEVYLKENGVYRPKPECLDSEHKLVEIVTQMRQSKK
jgi:transglutaminase-like putative cysteine protease